MKLVLLNIYFMDGVTNVAQKQINVKKCYFIVNSFFNKDGITFPDDASE